MRVVNQFSRPRRQSPGLQFALIALLVGCFSGAGRAESPAPAAAVPSVPAATTAPPAAEPAAPAAVVSPLSPPAGVAPSAPSAAAAATAPGPVAPPAAVPVKKDNGGRPLVTNSFFQTDLRQALSDLAAQVGVTIMTDDGVAGLITLDLKEVPLDKALNLMLLPGGFVSAEIEPGVWVVTAPDPKAPCFHLVAKTEVLSLSYLEAPALKGLLSDRLNLYVKADPDAHRVIVEAPPGILQEVTEAIRQLDLAPRQVMIEALVLETTVGALSEFDPAFATSHIAGGLSGGLLSYQSHDLGSAGGEGLLHDILPTPGNIVIGLKWLLRNNRALLRASPRIVSVDGKTAEIEVGTQQYFSLLTGSAAYAYTSLEQITATIKLTIKPRVVERTREVICDIEPNVSDVSGAGAGGLPVITVRRARATVCIKDGQALAIGGLIQSQSSRIESKVPLLGDIPLVGKLFRSSSSSKSQREIVILIAPHILNAQGVFEGSLLIEALGGAGGITDQSPAVTPPSPRPLPTAGP
ncbi:MAG TPA: secretin N-terminal domain-containing protein [Armatimonadota bacterium]|jgi:hypothetical protein